jgi:excisionase family DNA binding protein
MSYTQRQKHTTDRNRGSTTPMQLITPKEAAEQIGVSLTTVKTWLNRANDPLPSIVVGDAGTHRRVVADLIQPWLEQQAQGKIRVTK